LRFIRPKVVPTKGGSSAWQANRAKEITHVQSQLRTGSKQGVKTKDAGAKKKGPGCTVSRRETAPQLSAGFGSCVPDGQIKRGLDSPLSSTISTITPACFPVVHKSFNGKLSHESLLIHNTSSPTDHQKWRKSYPRRLIHFVVKRTVPQH